MKSVNNTEIVRWLNKWLCKQIINDTWCMMADKSGEYHDSYTSKSNNVYTIW